MSGHIRQDIFRSIRQEMRFERLNIEKKPEKKMKKVKRTAQQRNSKVCASRIQKEQAAAAKKSN